MVLCVVRPPADAAGESCGTLRLDTYIVSRDLFLKSAAQGYSPAMVNLGLMLTQDSNADTRGAVPRSFIDRSGSSDGIEQAVLTQAGIRSREPVAEMGTAEHLLLRIP